MRSNGLTASSYRPVADLNPTVAEQLLDELKAEQIAAYCQPIDSPSMSSFDRPEYRVEVLVRLYVDAAAADQVLALLSRKDPYLVQSNDDLAWAQLVAGYDTPAVSEVAPWPVYEDVDPDAGEPEPTAQVATPYEPDWTSPPSHRSRHDDDDDEGRFVPPTPPPLPHLSLSDQLSWLGVIGGPVVLVVAAIFTFSIPTWLTLVAALAFIGGFVTLVIGMETGQDRLDNPDDGAQL